MTDILLKLVLPASLAGTLFYAALLALRPLAARTRPGHRRAVLLAGGGLFLLPLGLPFLLPAAQAAPGAGVADTLSHAAPTAPVYRAGQALASMLEAPAAHAPASPAPAAFDLARLAAVVWLAGAMALAAVYTVRYALLCARLTHNATPVTNENTLALYAALCGELGVRRRPELYTGAVGTPVLAGVARPRIVLPGANCVYNGKKEADENALRFALRHELCHQRRGDLCLKLALLLPCVLHWFNPAAWLLRRAFARACEESCDEQVAKTLNSEGRRAYAAALLCCAGPGEGALASSFSTSARRLKGRLEKLVRPAQPGRALLAAAALALAVALCGGLLAGCSLAAGAADYSDSVPGSDLPPEDNLPPKDSTPPEDSLPPDDILPPADSLSPGSSLPPDTPEDKGESEPEGAAPTEGTLLCPVPEHEWMSRLMDSTHRGVDFNAPEGTPIYACAAGTVVTAEYHYSYGYYLIIDHGGGLKTLYAHNHTLTVAEGDVVEAGDLVATIGLTGQTTGPHCHLEVWLNDEAVDPMDYLIPPEGGFKNTPPNA